MPTRLYQVDTTQNPLVNKHAGPFDYQPRNYEEAHSLNYLKQQFEESSCLGIAVTFFNWIGWFCLSMTPISWSFFGVILSPLVGGILMFLILFLRLRRGYSSHCKALYDGLRVRNSYAYAKEIFAARTSYRKGLFAILLLAFGVAFSMTGGCIAFYEEYVGLRIEIITTSLSSTLSRYIQLSDACPPGPPCHIYATLPEDPSTSVFINLHTNIEYENIQIAYDEQDYFSSNRNLRFTQNATTIKLDYIEQRGRRSVHSALLSGLTQDTEYVIQIKYEGMTQATVNYITLPDETNPKNILLSTGGDLGDRLIGREVTFQAGAVDPDVLIVGGDLAYDDGEATCYFTWDNFFKSFADSILPSGRLIPFLFSVGNHDVGLNPLSGRVLPNNEKGPLYNVFFPQHTVDINSPAGTIKGVPALEERKSYHYHKIGKMIHFNLDNGYVSSFDEQVPFIQNVSTTYADYIKIVSQHNPAYWACQSLDNNQVVIDTLTKWVPLFDEHKFASIFENHEHAFKKTFPATDSQVNENGTYYLGNGNWGAKPDGCKVNNSTGLMEVVNTANHFWLVNISVTDGLIYYTPYDQNGDTVVPTFEQEIARYVE